MKRTAFVHGFLILFLLSAVPGHPQSLAEIAKKERERQAQILKKEKVITLNNQTLSALTGPPPKEETKGTAATPTPAAGTPAQAAAATEDKKKNKAEPGVYVDDQGRGEEYWRKTISDARDKIAKLEAELSQVGRKNPMSWEATINPKHNPQAAMDPTEDQRRLQKTTELQEKLRQTRQDLQNLQEEARRSGALPGWLR
jgi:DNA repair exonuclease SbcCD ATPase subunit